MNNNIKYFSIAIIAVLIVGGGLFFTQEEKPKEETFVVRMMDAPTTVHNWEIVKKLTGRDIIKEQGVKIEYINSVQNSGGTDRIMAILANNIDFGGGAWPAWINAISKGGKLKVIVGRNVLSKDEQGYTWVVMNNSGIYTAKDFIGKKVGLNVLGAESDYLTREYLKKDGLSIDQVTLITVPTAQLEQVLRTGQVDIIITSGANLNVALDRGGLRVLFTAYDLKGPMAMSGDGVREDFIKEHPETVKRFQGVYEISRRLVLEEFNKDPEGVKKAVKQIYEEKGGNPETAKYFTPNYSPVQPFIEEKDIKWWTDKFEQEGTLKPGQIKPSDVFTNEFNPYYKK